MHGKQYDPFSTLYDNQIKPFKSSLETAPLSYLLHRMVKDGIAAFAVAMVMSTTPEIKEMGRC